MTGEELTALLTQAKGEAISACLGALAGTSARVHARPEAVSTQNLLTIYRVRAEHIRQIGLPVLGIDETVQALASTDHERLRVVALEPEGQYPNCVVFLSPHGDEVVAALAVTGPALHAAV